MYDLSSRFNTFYRTHVVLPQAEQDELYEKKDINIQRLKAGLAEYNEEYGTLYAVVETCVQGSAAMSTIVQNEESDYDIDVAIVFDKDVLSGKGAQATRNIVANALSRKTKQFNANPEVKTSCVRVCYADGYHIDFAIYRRHYDQLQGCWIYEHAGADWTVRELRGLTDWFKEKNDKNSGKLRKVVRLSKMFCNSRDAWKNMPSGLIQTVLCEEKLESSYERIDELFYYTMKAIVERIETNRTVKAPVDNGRDLTPRNSDVQKMTNWKNRLKSKLEDLEILFNEECTECDAIQAWYGFFNHGFWNSQPSPNNSLSTEYYSTKTFKDTEQFIEDMFLVKKTYYCKVSCTVSGNGWRPKPLPEFLTKLRKFVPQNFEIRCELVLTNCPPPYSIYWKVKNVGPEAERLNEIRGQILEKGASIVEHSAFFGNHYIECYIIKDGVCVARERIEVPIGRG